MLFEMLPRLGLGSITALLGADTLGQLMLSGNGWTWPSRNSAQGSWRSMR